jgi:hypothetical protein
MSSVFYLRPIEPAIEPADVQTMATQAGGCFNLHRVNWRHSYLSVDGGRMLCWYEAPDAESARIALRELGSDMNAVWAGTVLGDTSDIPVDGAIVAELSFDEPLDPEARERLLDALARTLVSAGMTLVASFGSLNGAHVIAVVSGADEQAVRDALAGFEPAPASVWACTPILPELPSAPAA